MNGDGVSDAGELQTLAQAGISTINLYAAPVNFDLQGGAISGFTNFTRSNGQVGWAADVALEYEAEGLKVTGSGSGFVEITSASGLKMMMGTGVRFSETPSASAGYGGAVLTAGNDIFVFQPDSYSVLASAPSLLLEGLGGNDTLYGSWQDDWIDGGTGNDWLMGLDGDDVVVADSPGDTVTGGSGFDILQVSTGAGFSFTNTADKSFEGFLGGSGNDAFFGNVVTRYVLAGAGGNDTLVGNTLDDVLTGGDGADRLDGGAGTDTAVYTGLRSSYAISKGVGSYTVSGTEGSDTLLNIERIHFWDVDTAFDASGAAGKAFRAYEAALGRAPDAGGLGWFMNQLEHGISLAQLSGGLLASAEFTSHYGSSLTNSQFLTLLYANALHRAPDASGLAWWLTELSSNPSATRASAVTSFSESAECQALFVGVITAGVDYIPVV
jgi:Ca2+-binding RTX toxin-like protein